MRHLTVALLLLIAIALLWLAGEQHRENCIRDDRRQCSVLPWDDGKPPPGVPEGNPFE